MPMSVPFDTEVLAFARTTEFRQQQGECRQSLPYRHS